MIETTDWKAIGYLATGTKRQQAAYRLLKDSQLLENLARYNPVFIGTIPINVETATSDIDVACEVYDSDRLALDLQRLDKEIVIVRRDPIIIGRIAWAGIEVEIYGENKPVDEQNGFRHMIIEARLLDVGGDVMRKKIRQLKAEGVKTEPAFTTFLGIEGNAYLELLKLEASSKEELRTMVMQAMA